MARPKSTEARNEALAAAGGVVVDIGVGGFTVDEVVRRSGVAKTTIYRHWGSAQNLLFEAVEQLIVPEPEPNTGSLEADLREMGDFMLGIPTDIKVRSRRIFAGLLEGSIDDPTIAELFTRLHEERRRPVAAILTRAAERGEIDARYGVPPDLDTAVDVVVGPFFSRVLISDERLSEDDVDVWMSMIRRGLQAD